MSVTTMTIDALCVSPFNPRTNQVDANDFDALEKSLVASGQIYPLIVHPIKGRKRRFGILDGGRRYRAFSRAIADGKLPADHPIDVVVRNSADEGELRDLALAATFVRRELREYEIYAAVARAVERGRTFAEIAQTNGQPVETVKRWARLGNLHPTVFAALESDEIGLEAARAFGATADTALQLHVFEQFCAHPQKGWGNPAALIRKLMKIGDRDLEKLLHFVGDDAYRAAGGRYTLDLFADQAEQRGRVDDEGLLMQLADTKLEAIRARTRKQCGGDLRFDAAPPRLMLGNYDQGVDNALEIVAKPEPADAAQAQELAWLAYEMAHLEAWASFHLDDEALSEAERALCIAAIDEHYEPLEEQLDWITSEMEIALPIGNVVATLTVLDDGEVDLRFWWATRKDKQKAEAAARKLPDAPAPRPVSAGPIGQPASVAPPAPIAPGAAIESGNGTADRQKADALARDEHGLTAEGVQIMRSIRREMLRAALVTDAAQRDSSVALDYLLWSLARDRLTEFGIRIPGARSHERGMAGLSIRQDLLTAPVFEHLERTQAHRIWQDARALLKAHPSMTDTDLVQAFDAFRNESAAFKRQAAAIVAGCGLERSASSGGYDVELHDHVALLAGYGDEADCARLAEPTAEMIALLPRARQLELVHPHVGNAEYLALEKAKAIDLPGPVARALQKAKGWVHPVLRFTPRLYAVVAREMEAAKEDAEMAA